ncbi:MAG: hypothetical protein HQK87_11405, partial [Nitrospinae bacterium]|nr:hypothetical protein [Nitrospinota bacterium]
ASPLPEAEGLAAEGATDTFDLRYFDRSLVIDTCGRWSMAAAGDADHVEWRRLLTLVENTRRREPVNGVLVTIGVDELREVDADGLRERGKRLRSRLDELMRVMGSNIPVCLAVTKIDRLDGMPELWRRLDEESRGQAMGYQTPAPGRVETIVAAAFDSVVGALGDLALASLYAGGAFREGDDPRRLRRAALLIPREVESLRAPLAAFAQGAFADNPYQETPFLRGVYFLAALDGDASRWPLPEDPGFGPASATGAPASGGLFVRDLLSRIMPDDRGRETELLLARKRRRMTAVGAVFPEPGVPMAMSHGRA